MSGRTTIQLGILAAILASGIYLLDEHLGRRQTVRVQVQRVFDLTVEPVTVIGFEHAGRAVEFVRKGEQWFLQSPVRARANAPLVERVVASLETLRRQDLITSEHRGLDLADYGLEPARAKIVLETGGGRVETLSLGDRTPFGGAVYARMGRGDAVFTLPESVLTLFPEDLSTIRDRAVVFGSPEKTDRIDLYRRDTGFVRLVRQKSGWILQQPLEARADAVAVRRLLDSIFAMRVKTFHWDAETVEGADGETAARMEMALKGQIEAGGLAPDAARLRLTVWTDGDRLGQEVVIGRSVGGADGGGVYARKGGIDAVYTVPAPILEACSVPVDALRDRAVFNIAAGDIGFIRIQHGEDRLELMRRPPATGGGWRLQTPVRAPADTEAVNALITRLLGMRVAAYLPPSEDPLLSGTNIPMLVIGMAPSGTGGDTAVRESVLPTAELHLATSTLDGGAVRLARNVAGNEWFTLNDDAVKGFDETLVTPLHFRDRVMLAVNTGTVFRIQQDIASVTWRVERDTGGGPGEWRCLGGTEGSEDTAKIASTRANSAAVMDLLAAASRLEAGRFVAFMPPDLAPYGLGKPVAAVTFGFRSAETIQNTLLLGTALDSSWVHAMVQGHDFVFLLAAPVAARLVQPLCAPLPVEDAATAGAADPLPGAESGPDPAGAEKVME